MSAIVIKLKNILKKLDVLIEKKEKERFYIEKRKKNAHLDSSEKLSIIQNKPLRLNIGGKLFFTSEHTLLKYPNSLLYHESQNLNEDEIFFDRPYKMFKYILLFLRDRKLEFRINRYDREDLMKEMIYYRLDGYIQDLSNKFYDLEWNTRFSRPLTYIVDDDKISINTTECSSYFVIDKEFTDEDFHIEFEVQVTQTASKFYFGIVNEFQTLTTCLCREGNNAAYISLSGNVRTYGQKSKNQNLAFGKPSIVGLKVRLKGREKLAAFYVNDKKGKTFTLLGTCHRIAFCGCAQAKGSMTILSCLANKMDDELFINNSKKDKKINK